MSAAPTDLFEQQDVMPHELQALTSRYSTLLEASNIDRYKVCEQFLSGVQALGYTFDFGLDGEPHSLRIAEPGDLDLTRVGEEEEDEQDTMRPTF